MDGRKSASLAAVLVVLSQLTCCKTSPSSADAPATTGDGTADAPADRAAESPGDLNTAGDWRGERGGDAARDATSDRPVDARRDSPPDLPWDIKRDRGPDKLAWKNCYVSNFYDGCTKISGTGPPACCRSGPWCPPNYRCSHGYCWPSDGGPSNPPCAKGNFCSRTYSDNCQCQPATGAPCPACYVCIASCKVIPKCPTPY